MNAALAGERFYRKGQSPDAWFRKSPSGGEAAEKMEVNMDYLEIEKVVGREILDSRGNPTVLKRK